MYQLATERVLHSTAGAARGFHISPRQGELGDYVIERAFVEK